MTRRTGLAIAAGVLAGFAVLTGPVGLVVLLIFAVGGTAASQPATPCPGPGEVSTVGFVNAGGPLRIPIVGSYTFTSEYGWRLDPVTGAPNFHKGLDLITPGGIGTPVVAMQAAVVEKTYVEPWGANTVLLNHGGGLQSRYLHLQSWTVTPGQQVVAGQRIGLEGNTGHSTGPHLHWEIIVNGQVVDPRTWAAAHALALPGPRGSGVGPAEAGPSGPAADRTTLTPTAPAVVPVTAAVPVTIGVWNQQQLAIAAQIVAAGHAMQLDDWTITVAVMTGMGESGLRNIGFGDAVGPDSRGVFQQRDNGAWGTLADRMNPTTAATNFFTALVKVPNYRQLAPTLAAHAVQRNANPLYYAPFWADAVAVVAQLVNNPTLVAQLGPASGATVGCTPSTTPATSSTALPSAPTTAPLPPAGLLSPAPILPCPTGALATDPPLTAPARAVAGCVKVAFPTLLPRPSVAADTVDVPILNFRTASARTQGWSLARWLVAYQRPLKVSTVIFDSMIWSADRAGEGWRPYRPAGGTSNDTLACRDHVQLRTT